MITWTNSARERLEEHFNRIRPTLLAAGADPTEVTDDIRRHLGEELAASKMSVVTDDDVSRFLARISPLEASPFVNSHRPIQPIDPPVSENTARKSLHGWLLFFGVILPLLTIGIEASTHMCAAAFFDPIPSVWHLLLALSVPLSNLAAWIAVRHAKHEWRGTVGFMNAFALGASFYYALLYLPLTPFAIIAIIVWGWGLLPLSPLFSFIVAWRLRWLLKSTETAREVRVPSLGWGLATAVLALLLIALPATATRHWAQMAASEDSATRKTGLKWLRMLGHRKTLLGDCYGARRVANDAGWLFGIHGTPIPAETARNLYYRATGEPFNSVPPPQLHFASRTWDFLDEFSWDPEQGGNAVGGRIKGLSMAQSRLDGLTDPDAAWSYVEWTLEFKNIATVAREARAQIALPPGGVVSRLTLWVNGEEREAAFAGCSQVREAYRNVAVVQRRDPVLVTSCGPDRVLMQCFPVPPDGGTIKVRLGITAPLVLESAEQAVMRWPHFIERNFSITQETEHSLWIESAQVLDSRSQKLKRDGSKPGVNALRGQLPDAELANPFTAVRARRSPAVEHAWVTDSRADGRVVQQFIRVSTEQRPTRVVLVVDGSKGMTEFYPQIADAVLRVPEGTELTLLLAADGVEEFTDSSLNITAASLREMTARLRQRQGAGGQDNMPALLRALDSAGEKPGSAIVWIHGPQPPLLDNSEALKQRFDWRGAAANSAMPKLYDLQTSPGPNRIVEQFNGVGAMKAIPRLGSVRDDLNRLINSWRGEIKVFELAREQGTAGSLPVAGGSKQSSRHLARLWAFDEVLRLIAVRKIEAATQIAGKYQLVTPVSGAVVLETAQQFQQAGLEPVDSDSVPSVPEPSTWLLLGVGLGAIWVFLRHKRGRKLCVVK